MLGETTNVQKMTEIAHEVRAAARCSKKAADEIGSLRWDLWREAEVKDLKDFFQGMTGKAVVFLALVLLFCNLAVSVRILQHLEAAQKAPSEAHVQGGAGHP
jgi:hypothetical protein